MIETQTQTPVNSSGRTGDTCQVSGPYKCSTSPVVVLFVKKGDRFPNGPSSTSSQGQTTTWTIVNTQ
jgi:hypothetical protein